LIIRKGKLPGRATRANGLSLISVAPIGEKFHFLEVREFAFLLFAQVGTAIEHGGEFDQSFTNLLRASFLS
jgi:hypothetical protein